MRIAQMISGGEVNGAVWHCLMLSRALAARGHEVTVFHRPNTWVARELAGDDVRLEPTSFKRRASEFRRVGAVLRNLSIDVLHTHMTSAGNFGAALRLATGIPTIATAHTRRVKLHWMFNDRVIAPSPVTGTFHRRFSLVRRDRLVMIPNFIDAERFGRVTDARRETARRLLRIPSTAFVIGSVGVISARKRQSELVDAAVRLRQKGVDCHVVLVGAAEAGEAATIKALADAHGLGRYLTLTGPRNDIPEILPAFDVYCAASRLEEMPIAVLEAMAVGLPIVSTDVGGMPLLVKDGEGGYLVPPGSVEFLADGLNALARSPELRARMGAASAKKVRAEFSPEALVPRIEAVYARAAARGRRWNAHVAAATSSAGRVST